MRFNPFWLDGLEDGKVSAVLGQGGEKHTCYICNENDGNCMEGSCEAEYCFKRQANLNGLP